jgi:hypothetical protein
MNRGASPWIRRWRGGTRINRARLVADAGSNPLTAEDAEHAEKRRL